MLEAHGSDSRVGTFFNGTKTPRTSRCTPEGHATPCPAAQTPRLFPVSASGWICYAEKTHGSFLIPYLSTVRSPQQVMGSLVKDFFAQQQVTRISQL